MAALNLPLGQGRLRPCPGAARLAYDFTQVPATHTLRGPIGSIARVSCVAFDAEGALIVAGTAGGRVGVQQVEQYMPSAVSATSRALDADGGTSALRARPSDETRPLLEFEMQRALTTLCWRPGSPNQFAAAASAPIGGGGGPVVLIYDLASSKPSRPARRCLADASSQGMLHDIVFCDAAAGASAAADSGSTIVGGGRDGGLVAWDLRSEHLVLRPLSTSGFTLGKRARDFGTGSVSALARSISGSAICAGTSDGSVVVWDVRCLRSVVSCTRVGRGASVGVDSLLPHPRVGRLMVTQLSDGTIAIVDTETGHTLSTTDLSPHLFGITPAGLAAPPQLYSAQALMLSPQRRCSHGPRSGVSLAALAGAPTLSADHPVPAGVGGAAAAVSADAPAPRPGFRYRGGRLAWVHGDEWLCCAVPGEKAVAMVHVSYSCDRLDPLICTPTSSEVICLSPSPTGHFIALGLDDGTVGMMAPLPNRREAAGRAAAAEATAAAAAAAAADSDAAEARSLLDTAKPVLEPLLRGLGLQWTPAVQALELSFGPTAHEAESGSAPPAARADDVALFLDVAATDPSVLFWRLREEERLGDASSGRGRAAGLLRRARVAALAEKEEAEAAAQRRAERREIARQLEQVEVERRASAAALHQTEWLAEEPVAGVTPAATSAAEAPAAGNTTAAEAVAAGMTTVQASAVEAPAAGVRAATVPAAEGAALEADTQKPPAAVPSRAQEVPGGAARSSTTGAGVGRGSAGSMAGAGEGENAGVIQPARSGASAGSLVRLMEQQGGGGGRRGAFLDSGRSNRPGDYGAVAAPAPPNAKRGRSEGSHSQRPSGHSRGALGGGSVRSTEEGASGSWASSLSDGRREGRTEVRHLPKAPDQAKDLLKQASLARFFAPA